ncbi:MAG: MliC family protein [Candidatus Pacebacteria bacterium]|nr:MliC family protein [Candidatus Paceibacterota bacterium]
MIKKHPKIFIIFIITVAAALIWCFQNYLKENSPSSDNLISKVFYVCNDKKTIDASYYKGAPAPLSEPGQPPIPTGSVDLILGDGRKITLPQTISGSGIRYANSDESIVFFSKGNGSLILENNQQSYIGCIKIYKDITGKLPKIYENGTQGFSIRYPSNFTIKENYQYLGFGPKKEIGGISFIIPPSTSQGTNLGSDSYISIEEIPKIEDCSANLFIDSGIKKLSANLLTENDTTYSIASSTDAGAGNRYEETIYAIPGTNPCTAVRYFIHYSVLENYPPGSIKMFDKQALLDQFDAIRRTLIIQQ